MRIFRALSTVTIVVALVSGLFTPLVYPTPEAHAGLIPSESGYQITIGPIPGSTSANYVYASLFNPVGSGTYISVKAFSIQGFASTTALYQNVVLRRTSAASAGTQISAADIPKKNSDSGNAVAEVRHTNVTTTFIQSTSSFLGAINGAATSSLQSVHEVSFDDRETIVLQPGEGLALYQTAAGGVDQQYTLTLEWNESASDPGALGGYIFSFPRVENAAGVDYSYHTLMNPAGSGKTAVIERIRIDSIADNGAVYTNDVALQRISAASAGTQVASADIPKKHTSSANSVLEARHTGVTETLSGNASSTLMILRPPGSTNIQAGQEIVFGSSDEKLILQPGEGISLHAKTAGDIDQLIRLTAEWTEQVSAPSSAGEYMIALPRVEVTTVANNVYASFFNPSGSGKTAVVKRVYAYMTADTGATYQMSSLRRITAASGGVQVASADIPKKHSSAGSSIIEVRTKLPTVTLAGTVDSRILSMTSQGAIGQLHARKELYFGDQQEKLIIKEGEGIAFYSEGAGDLDQYVHLFIEWDEEASAPSAESEYLIEYNATSGNTTSGYVYATLFNPSASTQYVVIKRLRLQIDADTTAVYIPLTVRRISAASAGTQVAAGDIPKKNTASSNPTAEFRRTGVTVSYDPNSTDARLTGATSPGTVGGAVSVHTYGFRDFSFDSSADREPIVLGPGQGIALYQEAASDVDVLPKLYVEWAEVTGKPAPRGDYSLSFGPVTSSATSDYVYGSLFNPSGSGKRIIVRRVNLAIDRVTSAATASVNKYNTFSVRRTTAASGGSQIAAANIPRHHSTTTTASAEARHTGVTTTFAGSADSRILAVKGPAYLVGSSHSVYTDSVVNEYEERQRIAYDDEIILQPGEGIALYQEGAGEATNLRVRMEITWSELELSQSSFRFFANADSTDVGSALANLNTAGTITSPGGQSRLRMTLTATGTPLHTNHDAFKLQFAAKSGTCDTAFSGETYADITGASVIAYHNNGTPADGVTLTSNANDPQDGVLARIYQTYEELNNFTNASTTEVGVGQSALWDFALDDNGASANTSYCIRAVHSNGDLLDVYTVIPEITTAAGAGLTFVVSHDNFPAISPGVRTFATTTLSVDYSGGTGWHVTLSGDDQSPTDTVMDLSTDAAVGITDQLEWIPGAATTSPGNAVRIASLDNSGDVLAFRIMSASGSVAFRAATWWGSADTYTDNANTLWAGIASSTVARRIGNSSVSSGGGPALSTVLYYLDVPITQQTGTYSGGITYTATANP